MDLFSAAAPFLMMLVAALVLYPKRGEIRDQIEIFLDNFRGGPPSGPHPSPACDSAFLREFRVKLPRSAGWAAKRRPRG